MPVDSEAICQRPLAPRFSVVADTTAGLCSSGDNDEGGLDEFGVGDQPAHLSAVFQDLFRRSNACWTRTDPRATRRLADLLSRGERGDVHPPQDDSWRGHCGDYARAMDVYPVFAVADLSAAIDFYTSQLGFAERWRWGEPPTRAGVSLEDLEIHLDAADQGAPPGPSVIYCHVDDVRPYYEACRERGVSFVFDLTDREWGMRDFRVEDPSGNRIGFASPL